MAIAIPGSPVNGDLTRFCKDHEVFPRKTASEPKSQRWIRIINPSKGKTDEEKRGRYSGKEDTSRQQEKV